MTTPRYTTHWEVSAWHPDRVDPYDHTITFWATEELARSHQRTLAEQGWEHITVLPPMRQRPSAGDVTPERN